VGKREGWDSGKKGEVEVGDNTMKELYVFTT
jgi:hypothetical protein